VQVTQPLALWLLLLVPLPLLLAQRRRQRRRHEVANVYLWTEARQRELGGPAIRRTRRRWSALVQAAALAAVAAGLAGPVVTGGGTPSALVIDASASMGARAGSVTRLDLAKAAARRELHALPSNTRVAIVEASDTPRRVGLFTASDAAAVAALDALQVTSGGADVQAALDLASSMGAVRAVLFSDGAPHVDGGQVRVVTVGQPADNVAVTALVAAVRELGGTDGDVAVQLHHYGTSTRSVTLVIDSGGQTVQRTSLTLGPGAVDTVQARVPSLGAEVTARVDADDALASDNARTVRVVDASRRLRVGYIGRPSGALHAALATLPSIQLVPLAAARAPECVGGTNVPDVEVLVIEGCEPVPVARPTMFVLPARSNVVRAIATLGELQHPVASTLTLDDASVVVGTPLALEVGDVSLIEGGDQVFVAASERRGVRAVHVGLDVSRSPFVLTPGFPVLVANAVEWLGESAPATSAAGAPTRPANVDASESDLTAAAASSQSSPVTLAASAAPDRNVAAWAMLAGVGLLLVEWQLRMRGV
jgi:hypothetical protein